MRIGIDCRTMLDWRRDGEAAGIGHYTFYLVKHLLREDRDNQYVLFLDRSVPKRVRREIIGDNDKVLERHFPFQAFKHCLPFVYSHMVISSIFERAGLDLLHAPANSLPLFYRRRAVITVHDLAIYDHPEWFPNQYPGSLSFSERVVVPYSVRKSKRIIAVSQQTKADLMRIFELPADKIDVVYEGAEPPVEINSRKPAAAQALADLGLKPKRYFLYLGTIEPRKNIGSAAKAFAEFVTANPAKYQDIDFVVAGRHGWKFEPTLKAVAAANAQLAEVMAAAGQEPRERIRCVGYLAHDVKPAVFASAAGFVFPSFYEGFGLPVIEAMSLGVPVITSRRSSLPEICGDAAILIEPEDTAAIATAMRQLIDDQAEAAKLSQAGLVCSSGFSWQRTARETLKVYQKAARRS